MESDEEKIESLNGTEVEDLKTDDLEVVGENHKEGAPADDTLSSDQEESITFDDVDQSEKKRTKQKLSHYQRPDPKPIAVFTAEFDDLSFEKCSAAQTYENFIKEAYSKAQRQVEQSRSMMEAHAVQQVGDVSRFQLADDTRPIRSFGRCYDTTYSDDYDKTKWIRTKLKSEDSITSDFSESGCTDDASSSSNEDRPARTWETNVLYGNRRYYSRYDQGKDPDYFDFDLNHSVDMFRKPKLAVAPRAPTYWEHQLFKDKARIQGNCAISPLMFKHVTESETKDGHKTAMQTSFISSALRTPSYWEYRYQHMNGSPCKP